jgi:uncharacterized protein YbjT (DUF2867 family)
VAIVTFGRMSKTALIIGATGLTGQQCLIELLDSLAYEKLIVLSRTKLQTTNGKLQNIITDFKNLESLHAQLGADHVYCCIGTTIAKAGSQEAFRHVDYEIPLEVAEMAKRNGAEKFILVSSLGADASSSIFYSKVKGQLEQALAALNYKSLLIFRPSILLGDRKEKRTGEAIGQFAAEKLSFLFAGPLKKYRGTPVDTLAKVMVKLANETTPKVRIIENEEIFVLADKLK